MRGGNFSALHDAVFASPPVGLGSRSKEASLPDEGEHRKTSGIRMAKDYCCSYTARGDRQSMLGCSLLCFCARLLDCQS